MEQERIFSYLTDPDLPNGYEQKNVIIQRDRFGYGLTVSGDNPVYVLSVREGGAAHRAGINTNDQIIKVNGTRVTHCTHIDVVNLIKSGAYAQLTLLGPAKGNITSPPPKPTGNDSSNGRVLFRTQFSIPERSNSTISSNSVQSVSDTKKARDAYERIVKQLEASKKDLDRQRAKSLNHNPTKICQIENQIRLYEQQLNEIKRRLESIETPADGSSVKSSLSDENLVHRPHTYIESSNNRISTQSFGSTGHKKQNSLPESAVLQIVTGSPLLSTPVSSPLQHIKRRLQTGRSEAYDLAKYWDSSNQLSGDEYFKLRELSETDDDGSHSLPSNLQAISSFDDLQQLINTFNWIPLTIFLHFLLTDPNSDPSQLLFYILTEELRGRKAENRSEFIRWIFEIHSTFTMNSSPLHIGLPQSQTDAINRSLENQHQDPNDDLKSIFTEAREYTRSVIADRQLTDFHHKRTLNVNNDLIIKPSHFIEEALRAPFEFHYKSSNTDDWNSLKNARSLALLCALATYLKRCDIKKCGNIPLEKIPKFLDREQRRLLAKLQRTAPVKKIRDHQLNEHQFSVETLCQVCFKPLWGINYQGYLCGYCQQVYHRECASNSEKCSKDRAKGRKMAQPRHPSRSVSADNLRPTFFSLPIQLISHRNPFQRSAGGSSTLFHGITINVHGPTRTTSMIEGREGSIPNDMYEMGVGSSETFDPVDGQSALNEQSKLATVGRCSSDRRAAPDRPSAPKNRSSSESDDSDEGNPQMGGNSIDEFLNSDTLHQQHEFTNQNSSELSSQTISEGDSDLEVDVNTLPNLSEFIRHDILQVLYQTREWKFQTTINELIHTERTHLRSLKIMKRCFREPMEHFPGMSPVELDCIFRNLDQLIDLHTQFKYALRQHREEAPNHVVRTIGDLVLRFLDGDKGEQFARACAYFIEDQSQALKLIKKKEQSADFAALMRSCESNNLCRRLTLKDYLPSIMTRFTKYRMLFEAMKKFVADDPVESAKLTRCAECADNILKRMNYARFKKEQEALLKQIKSNLDIQIPNDNKLQNLQDCLEVTNDRLIYSGTLRLLPDLATQKAEFECCLFTDIFVFFQKILVQPAEQRGIEETYRYVLKEHQRDASNGRQQRPRTASNATKYTAAQNFILTPIIRLEHLLIKKKACGGARSFYVIDTDKKQLIEVEANSKDDLEKWLEWIEKARRPFEKPKAFPVPSMDKGTHSSSSSSSSTVTSRSTITEEQSNLQSNEISTPESWIDSIIVKDKELNRLIHEKQLLLLRLLNLPADASIHAIKAQSSLEAITYATSYHNQLMQIINQVSSDPSKTVELQAIWAPVIQLGEQLTSALKFLNQDSSNADDESRSVRRNSSSLTTASSATTGPSQLYSELSISESINSVDNLYAPASSVTDLDETIKPSALEQLQGRYDEVGFDDGSASQLEDEENTSVVMADSDEEDEIEHFDASQEQGHEGDSNNPDSNSPSTEAQTIKLDLHTEEVYDNLQATSDPHVQPRNASEA